MKDNIIIGIDPDCEKSGIAIIEPCSKTIFCMNFVDLVRKLNELINIALFENLKLTVYVEAGWLNKSNWHLPPIEQKMHSVREVRSKCLVSCSIGNKTGRNHQLGICIVDMCALYGIKCVEVRPTNTKLKAEQFKKLTGITQRLNQEGRDAYMLAWRHDRTTNDNLSDKF